MADRPRASAYDLLTVGKEALQVSKQLSLVAEDRPNDALALMGMLCEADIPHEMEVTPTMDEEDPNYDPDTDDVHAITITGVARFEFEGNALKGVRRV